MLNQIAIYNFIFIEEEVIQLSKGLNVISGETGAGKSIFLGALNTTLGERISIDFIQPGKNFLKVISTFDLKPLSNIKQKVEKLLKIKIKNHQLSLRREMNREGKSKCFINDHLTNIKTLKQIAYNLIDIHAQHQNQRLFNINAHIELYDKFLNLDNLNKIFQKNYQDYKLINYQIEAIQKKEKKIQEEKELLLFNIKELEGNLISEEEYNSFKDQLKKLEQKENFDQILQENYFVLKNEILPKLYKQKNSIEALNTSNEKLKNLKTQYLQAIDLLEEIENQEEKKFSHTLDNQSLSIDQLNNKLAKAESLRRKYALSLLELQKKLEESKKKLLFLEDSHIEKEKFEKEKIKLENEVFSLAQELHKRRKNGKDTFEKKIQEEISFLGMTTSKLAIDLNSHEANEPKPILNENGIDYIEFLYQAAPEAPFRRLKEIASGGEISRIMLSLKSLLNEKEDIPVMIFDEIDAGIGGATALHIGNKLSNISHYRQVLVITHLAQIAKFANTHFKISKKTENNKTNTNINILDENQKIIEIARMLTGKEFDEKSKQMAQDFLDS